MQQGIRKQAYYRINRLLKQSYHARIRAGEAPEIFALYKAMNDRIVGVFAHGGIIDGVTAAALGHTHGGAPEEESESHGQAGKGADQSAAPAL